MTLVIASKENNKIYLFSDTLISFDSKLGRSPYQTIKVLSLSPNVALAFSGSHDIALEIFFDLYRDTSASPDVEALARHIQQRCSAVSIKFGDESSPEFLLVCFNPELTITKITDQHIIECPQYGWISNARAAAKVSRVADLGQDAIRTEMSRMIIDSEFHDVGSYLVAMQSQDNGFKFCPYMILTSPKYIPVEGWSTIDFETAQTGSFGFTTITPLEPGRNGFGIFLFQGFVGLFFHIDIAGRRVEILKAYARSAEDFMQILSAEIGFPLEHCGSLG
ncbi:hypothetical protein ACXZ1M_23880 [Duganella sp. PWIR1]